MICGKCPEGRRFNDTGIYCVHYGMILTEKHVCALERGKEHDRAEQDNTVQGLREGDRLYQNGEGEEHAGGSGERVLYPVGRAGYIRDGGRNREAGTEAGLGGHGRGMDRVQEPFRQLPGGRQVQEMKKAADAATSAVSA